jgi:hypothetical protein
MVGTREYPVSTPEFLLEYPVSTSECLSEYPVSTPECLLEYPRRERLRGPVHPGEYLIETFIEYPCEYP